MELKDAVAGRRSVRHYTEEAIPRELLAELLETACWRRRRTMRSRGTSWY